MVFASVLRETERFMTSRAEAALRGPNARSIDKVAVAVKKWSAKKKTLTLAVDLITAQYRGLLMHKS